MIRRFVLTAAVASAGLLVVGGGASAHIDPDPAEAQAGARLTVGFTVEHGCEGSPTVQLDMRLPDGVTEPVPENVDGWDGSIEMVDGDTIVTYAGGPLADDVEGTFSVTMTLPPTADTTVYFPFVQRCDVGEIRWIGIAAQPGDDLDEPAPAMRLTGPVAAAPTTAATPTTEPAVTQTTVSVSVDSTSTEPAAQTSSTPASSEPVLISTGGDELGDSGTGTIVFIASIAAVLGLGAFVVYRSRQARAAAAPDAS